MRTPPKATCNSEERVFLRTSRVARMLDLSARQIQLMIARNELAAVRVGRSWRVPASAITQLLETAMKSIDEVSR